MDLGLEGRACAVTGASRTPRGARTRYEVVAAFCIVDREEGGTELIAKRYPFYPLFTAKELLNDAQA